MIHIENVDVIGLESAIRDTQNSENRREKIQVSAQITAPLYWYNRLYIYDVKTIGEYDCFERVYDNGFSSLDFSVDRLLYDKIPETELSPSNFLSEIINNLNECVGMFIRNKDKVWWVQVLKLLPQSQVQTRTIKFTYEALSNIYHAEKNNQIEEWRKFCDWIETLPSAYMIQNKEI